MHYYLADYEWQTDVFRPAGVEPGQDFSAIDLRADPSQGDGHALLALPAHAPHAHRTYLGDDLDDPSPARRNVLAKALDVPLDALTLRDGIAELLIGHGREDGTRWKPIRTTQGRHYEVWLGHERIVYLPLVRGGLTATDSFNRADETPLSGGGNWAAMGGSTFKEPNLSGSIIVGSGTASELSLRRYVNASWGDDQYTEAVIRYDGVDGASGVAMVRGSGSASTAYVGFPYIVNNDIRKWVAGTPTVIATGGGNQTNGSTYRLTVTGSALVFRNVSTSTDLCSVSDASITTGSPGIGAWSKPATSAGSWADDWTGFSTVGDHLVTRITQLMPYAGLPGRQYRSFGGRAPSGAPTVVVGIAKGVLASVNFGEGFDRPGVG